MINNSVLFPGAPFTRTADPSTRLTWMLNYTLNDWTVGLQNTWVSGFSQVTGPVLPAGSALAAAGLNQWLHPHVNSWNQADVNISRNFEMEGADMTAYFVVQNILNAQPAYVPNGPSARSTRAISRVTTAKARWAATSRSASKPICEALQLRDSSWGNKGSAGFFLPWAGPAVSFFSVPFLGRQLQTCGTRE